MTKNRPEQDEDGFIIVYDPADIPEFASEADEARFWGTHSWSDELLAGAAKGPRDPDLPPPRPRGKKQAAPISLRLEGNITERLKRLAARKGMGYQTLLKQFVLERLYEEEKREDAAEDSHSHARRA